MQYCHLTLEEEFPLLDVHPENGLAGVRHGGADRDVVVVVGDAGAVGLGPDEAVLAAVVHDVVQLVVAAGVTVKDSHCEPVGVEHSVKGHRVHDGH